MRLVSNCIPGYLYAGKYSVDNRKDGHHNTMQNSSPHLLSSNQTTKSRLLPEPYLYMRGTEQI